MCIRHTNDVRGVVVIDGGGYAGVVVIDVVFGWHGPVGYGIALTTPAPTSVVATAQTTTTTTPTTAAASTPSTPKQYSYG